jgi:hypothetical protein
MANQLKPELLAELKRRYGSLRKLDATQSLFEIGGGAARVYVRYSKLHQRNQGFYGLREGDLRQLEGLPSAICFLWPGQMEPLFVPFTEYEEVFRSCMPATDGQYKAIIYPRTEGTEMVLPKVGRFNVEGHFGFEILDDLIDKAKLGGIPDLTHPQVQTMLGAVGVAKGYDVWIPSKDRVALDWSLSECFECRHELPTMFESILGILQEIDVIWLQRGSSDMQALFEIEHSTPIYSGLLRFNDVHLTAPAPISRFTIVSNDARRALFARQVNRPTFRTSGLSELCTFLEYVDVFGWHKRVIGNQNSVSHENEKSR